MNTKDKYIVFLLVRMLASAVHISKVNNASFKATYKNIATTSVQMRTHQYREDWIPRIISIYSTYLHGLIALLALASEMVSAFGLRSILHFLQ